MDPKELWLYTLQVRPRPNKGCGNSLRRRNLAFVLNTVLPNMTFGQIFSAQQPASSGRILRKAYYGDISALKNFGPLWMVDVKDTARLHVAALIDPEVENERILGCAYPFNCNDILACLRKLYPNKIFPHNIEDDSRTLVKLDNRRGEELLKKFGRPGWTGLEESIQENTACLE